MNAKSSLQNLAALEALKLTIANTINLGNNAKYTLQMVSECKDSWVNAKGADECLQAKIRSDLAIVQRNLEQLRANNKKDVAGCFDEMHANIQAAMRVEENALIIDEAEKTTILEKLALSAPYNKDGDNIFIGMDALEGHSTWDGFNLPAVAAHGSVDNWLKTTLTEEEYLKVTFKVVDPDTNIQQWLAEQNEQNTKLSTSYC